MTDFFRQFLRYFLIIRQKIVLTIFLLFAATVSFGYIGLYIFEYQNIGSQFNSPFDIFYFLAITITTVGYGDFTPQTTGGRVVISMVAFVSVIFISLWSAMIAALLIESKLKEEMGMKSFVLRKHIVIIGWNLKGPKIVEILRNQKDFRDRDMVVIADLDKKPTNDPLIHFVRSDIPTHSPELKRASIGDASTVILLADYGSKQGADALTAVNCLMVRKHNKNARVIAEMLDPSQREYLETAGANQIIGIGEVGGFLIAETTIGNDKVMTMMREINSL